VRCLYNFFLIRRGINLREITDLIWIFVAWVAMMSIDENKKLFVDALNNACGEISEAAKLSSEIFPPVDLKVVRRELARLMEIIDLEILSRLPKK